MKAADIMSTGVVTVGPDAPIGEAARLMLQHRISGLPVVDAHGTLAGIVTEGDLLRRAELGTERRRPRWLELILMPGTLAEDYVRSHGRRVEEVMSWEVATVAPDTPLAEVVALMQRRRIKRVPVVDGGKLVGMISRADLIRALARELEAAPETVGDDLAIRRRILDELDRAGWAPAATIAVTVTDGVAELRGTVTDERVREGIVVAAENTPGVKQVKDELTVLLPVPTWL